MNTSKKKKIDSRIWELDALRGFMILCVIVVHTLFDIEAFFDIDYPAFYIFIKNNGGILFVVLSGICATLGTKTFKRGLFVFGAGMLVTIVTFGLYYFGIMHKSVIISFGVLHLLGICMMIYPVMKQLPNITIGILGVLVIILGYCITGMHSDIPFSYIIGIPSVDYAAGDWFPLVPFAGWFFIGIFLGNILYKKKQSLFPNAPKDFFIIRFFRWCGVYSLYIYLIHQPIVFGLVFLFLYR
ncbi:MAG: DUF1624 domain-containing protein [Ruminococcaceae bacterium]|nr:DUF1624 domain-containing protein [Oscillospiraceae bacterium]